MNRRAFIFRTAGLALTAYVAPTLGRPAADTMDRIAMGTLIMRYRFKQTKPKEMATIPNELTLPEVAGYYRDRFGVRQIEFWSNHFESIETPYLTTVRDSIKAAGSKLLNVQFDFPYDLAAASESDRTESVKTVKQWIDACAFLGTACVRVNPGKPRGVVENSIKSLKEVNDYAKCKNIIVITANHFGLEMSPDVHVRVVKEAGPENIYTEPDFGNYPHKTMFASLEKIIPYAYIISAKTDEFNSQMEHTSYDFDKCVRMCEDAGFKGRYMVSQYSGKYQPLDYAKVADWVIEHLKANMKA
jgi:sugar phosphate isomerase/epimerase